MKKAIFILFFGSLIIISVYSQSFNINPDTIPLFTGGVPILTPEFQQEINDIPKMQRNSFIEPIDQINNSQEKYMRPIFSQTHESCAQASGVGYVFTYEINWMRNLHANGDEYTENQYPTHFTYNFLNDGDSGNGSVIYKGWGEVFELSSDYQNESIQYGHNWYSIDYDLLVPGDNQVITQNTYLNSNMVSRFIPSVTNSSTLVIGNHVEIDMYNSELIIEEGSTLIIGDNAVFTAKRGISKIVVNGNIQIGNDVLFTADENSKNVNMYDFSSGIYFYSLQQNGITIATNKMVIY